MTKHNMQIDLFRHIAADSVVTFDDYLYRLCEETVCTINNKGNYEVVDGYMLFYDNMQVLEILVNKNTYSLAINRIHGATIEMSEYTDISRFNCYANINSVLLD